jgi:hypothetical protein
MTGVIDDWTIERHLKDKPAEVVALYDRFIELVTQCGLGSRDAAADGRGLPDLPLSDTCRVGRD